MTAIIIPYIGSRLYVKTTEYGEINLSKYTDAIKAYAVQILPSKKI